MLLCNQLLQSLSVLSQMTALIVDFIIPKQFKAFQALQNGQAGASLDPWCVKIVDA